MFLPTDFDNKFIFFYACQFNYYTLVKLYLKYKAVDIKEKVISSSIFRIGYEIYFIELYIIFE